MSGQFEHVWSIEITRKHDGEPVDHFVCRDQRLSVEIAIARTALMETVHGRECEWLQRYVPVFE